MRIRMLPGLCALIALAIMALTATPATAGSAAATTRGICGEPTFDFFANLERSGTARSGSPTPRTEKETEQYSGSTEIDQKTPGKSTAGTIDVYFHVVTKEDRTGDVSARTIAEQIAVLNMAFSGFYGGADTGFRFALAGTTRTENDAWFDQKTFADEVEMKLALKQGGSTDLNVYSTSAGPYLGWAYYPSITASQQFGVLDGVVIDYGSLPGGSTRNYDLGYTATHEVGHWLGLPHTFEQGCLGHGDSVDDTPFQATPTTGCPVGKDTCTRDSGDDPIHNYMDYSYDACYTEFTEGQTDRMQKQFAHWRLKRV